MSLVITPPILPYRGARGVDSYGAGNFGASRDGGTRQHLGTDFVALPGDTVVAPIPGNVVHVGVAYAGSDLCSIHIHGDGEFSNWRVKLLYVTPDIGLLGRYVWAGNKIGEAQDVAAYHAARNPGHVGAMKNHVHLEVIVTEPRHVDPAHFLPHDLVVHPVRV